MIHFYRNNVDVFRLYLKEGRCVHKFFNHQPFTFTYVVRMLIPRVEKQFIDLPKAICRATVDHNICFASVRYIWVIDFVDQLSEPRVKSWVSFSTTILQSAVQIDAADGVLVC